MNGLQGLLGALLLPPLSLALAGILAGLLAWRGRRWAGLLAACCALGLLLLATPLVAGLLMASLEREIPPSGRPEGAGAVIILGGDVAHGAAGIEVGMLTLERLRAGAAAHRAAGLPILVTGGVLGHRQPALATLMARSLREDFGVPVRWIEDRARDTRENAAFAAALLRSAGIGGALLVTHAWHMPRAVDAFRRQGFPVRAHPLRIAPPQEWIAWRLVPRADHLAESWFALREWAGRAVYAARDGGVGVSADFTGPEPRGP